MVYKEATDYARHVIEFLADFKRRTGRELETLDPETPAGISFCEAYDIVAYPTLIALSDSGQLLTSWEGLPLPTISEVSYYA